MNKKNRKKISMILYSLLIVIVLAGAAVYAFLTRQVSAGFRAERVWNES